MKRKLYVLLCCLLTEGMLTPHPLVAQQPIWPGGTYVQDFDGLHNKQGSGSWPISSLPHWFIQESGWLSVRNDNMYFVDHGDRSIGDTYSFGPAATTERALGELGEEYKDAVLNSTFGIRFTNTGRVPIRQMTIQYTGEQWREGYRASGSKLVVDRLFFDFSTNSTDGKDGTWTNLQELTFTARHYSSEPKPLNGNLSVNQASLSMVVVFPEYIAPGASLWLRWRGEDLKTADAGLAVDNFSVTNVLPLSVSDVSFLNNQADLRGPSESTDDNAASQPFSFNPSSDEFRLYPSPASTYLTVQFNKAPEQVAHWQIISFSGQSVRKGVFTQDIQTIDIENLSEGAYWLQVLSAQGIQTAKFLVGGF